jgi:hypothetical protein
VVDSGDKALQAAILTTLCNGDDVCSFVATRQDAEAYTPIHTVGNSLANDSNTQQVTKIVITDTQTQSDSIQVAAKAGGSIAKIVNVEISITYGHTWTDTHTFTQEIDLNVPPHSVGTIYAQQPVYRVYGDFTIEYLGQTFVLKDVYFDTPDGSRNGKYEVKVTPLDT